MKQILAQIEYLNGMQKVTASYQEIAAGRMQKIRQEVLTNRDYYLGIAETFQIVRNSYQKQYQQERTYLLLLKKPKTARVFISANAGLYGDIVQLTFGLFRKELVIGHDEAVVVGQIGKALCNQAGIKDFTYFDFPDAKLSAEDAKKMIDYLTTFETTIVYHGRFKNVLEQTVVGENISGNKHIAQGETSFKKRLIFEPSLLEVTKFFETEIFASLMIQTLYESQLAKFSSRMVSLDQANENINTSISYNYSLKERKRHRLMNRKQLDLLAGIQLWNT